MITRCHRCEQDRCTECTPTVMCYGCHGVDSHVQTCRDCEQPYCTFCDPEDGTCKECLGAICPDCWSLSNKSERAGACRPCFAPRPSPEPVDHGLPDGFSIYKEGPSPYNEAELKLRTPPHRLLSTDARKRAWTRSLNLPHDPKTGRFLPKGEERERDE